MARNGHALLHIKDHHTVKRTEREALKEIRSRLVYLCAKLDGTYSPPWVKELVDIADDGLKCECIEDTQPNFSTEEMLQKNVIQQTHELGALLAKRGVEDDEIEKFLNEDASDESAPSNIEELREKAVEALAESKRDEMDKIASNVFYTLHSNEIADKLIERVNSYANLNDYDALDDFNFSMCDHDELAAVDEYILQCQRFADAQNAGLSGLGLYTFNNDRMKAHECMLEAWRLSDDAVAMYATKGFDFCSRWNYKTKQYDAMPKEEAEQMLCWVLWKCRMLKENGNYEDYA